MYQLELDVEELIIFAHVYSYHRAGKVFFGTSEYLKDIAICSYPTCYKKLQHLCDLGYFIKTETRLNGCVSKCTYSIDDTKIPADIRQLIKTKKTNTAEQLRNKIYSDSLKQKQGFADEVY